MSDTEEQMGEEAEDEVVGGNEEEQLGEEEEKLGEEEEKQEEEEEEEVYKLKTLSLSLSSIIYIHAVQLPLQFYISGTSYFTM